MGLFWAVRMSYSIPWTVWKCKSDFYQMFLAYPDVIARTPDVIARTPGGTRTQFEISSSRP